MKFNLKRALLPVILSWVSIYISSGSAMEGPTEHEQKLIKLTNQERAKASLSQFNIDMTLIRVARESSNYMAERNESAHHRPFGKTCVERVTESGYATHKLYSQEVIMTYPCFNFSEQHFSKLMKTWMDSLAHKKIILNQSCVDIGVGIATSSEDLTFFTMVFSRKDSKPTSAHGGAQSAAHAAQIHPASSSSASSSSSSASASKLKDLESRVLGSLKKLELAPELPNDLLSLSFSIVGYINEQRCSAHLPKLAGDPRLDELAVNDATYMAKNKSLTYNHGPKTPIDRIIESGYCKHRYSTELISSIRDQSDDAVKGVVQKWMEGTASKQILDLNYQTVGAGLDQGDDGLIYIAVVLTRPTPFYGK